MASRWERMSGADTGPADSVDIDSGPPTAATLGLTIILGGEEEGHSNRGDITRLDITAF